jgi:hypothetical protein
MAAFRSIGSLATSPVTATPNVGVYETALMNGDTGTMSFDGFPGGTHQKIVRWSFEKQGLHQPSGAPTPVLIIVISFSIVAIVVMILRKGKRKKKWRN